MEQCKIYLGPPGCGKTTKLIYIVEDYISNGGDINKVAFLSFTRKAVSEVVDRLKLKHGINKKDLFFFRTIHSFCFNLLQMSRDMVIKEEDIKEIFESSNIETEKRKSYVLLDNITRLKQSNYENIFNEINPDFGFEEFNSYISKKNEEVKSKFKFDFTDILEFYLQYGNCPAIELLIVDEAQDLSKLQWSIVNKIMKFSKNVYIAGDDDQAIFQWAGADVDKFIGLCKKYPVEFLNNSYRLPKDIMTFSENLLKKISNRIPKVSFCNKEEGKVNFCVDLLDCPIVDKDSGNWLVLVRNNYQINSTVDFCRSNSLPYTAPTESSADDEYEAAVLWEQQKQRELTIIEKSFLFNYLKINDKKLNWDEALNIDSVNKEYIRSVLRNKEKIDHKSRIVISTIHKIKGGESDNVFLFVDITKKEYESMNYNPDAEHRLFYVAVTRAKKNLYICNAKTNIYYAIGD